MGSRGRNASSSARPATSGRPRDDRLTQRILEAARELALERGFDSLRIKDVASRAGTGIDTIYRRWEGKTDLLIDVFRSTPPVDHTTGAGQAADLRSDVVELARAVRDWSSYFAGLAIAAQEHPALEQAVAENLRVQTDSLSRKISGVSGASDPERARLAAETIMAVLMYRATFSGDAIEPEGLADRLIVAALTFAGSE